jgi:hypothetical protein
VLPRLLAVIAALEGVALLVYAVIDIVAIVREGMTGPAEVSNPAAFAMQVLIFVVLGVGLGAVARGWWNLRRWARGPFILAQLLGLVVGVPLAQSTGLGQVVGGGLVLVAASSLVVSLLPPVTRALHEGHAAT